ncbi:MAG TPA: hypothetical protein VL486_05485 [Verrucomicrobiae bacterium]|nr:hypothetical protein [Verrucomicrobiae bacterium]
MNEPRPTRERRDLNVHVIVIFFGSLVVTGILVSLVARGTFAYFARRYPAAVERPLPPVANPGPPVTAPKLLANPAKEMRKLRVHEDALLTTYGWVDPDRGVVRIPIAHAIDLVAERGLPVMTNEVAAAPAGGTKP